MPVHCPEYQEFVLEALKNTVGLFHPVHTSLPERLLVRKIDPKKLHPNPDDEFCDPAYGPNYSIVSKYENHILDPERHLPMEPLEAQKLNTGGYMLLNGHHRWLAGIRLHQKSMPLHIVNPTSEAEILSAVSRSVRDRIASFDLDEILLTDGQRYPKQKKLFFPFNLVYRETLRLNAAALINELHRQGFDVWVYTGHYHSAEYLRLLFFLHGTKVDGIINGLGKKKDRSRIRSILTSKYRLSLHVDNESLLCVDTGTKDYESQSFSCDAASWASAAAIALKKLEVLKDDSHAE